MVLIYNFRGFMAPVFTPFKDNLDVNYSIIPKYAEYLKEHKVLGILVNGTTGEGVSLNVSERKLVTEEWVKARRQTQHSLMVQIGGTSLIDVIDLAKHAELQKVDAILCLPELFFKPKTSQELCDYLKLVSYAAPKTPLLYYHIPSFSDVKIDMGNFIEIACNEIPTFAGIKFTSTDMDEGLRCITISKQKGINVFLGADQILSAAIALGFDSAIAISLNIWPELMMRIQSNMTFGKVTDAIEDQNKIAKKLNEASLHVIFSPGLGGLIPFMKKTMHLTSGIKVGLPRPPLMANSKFQSDKHLFS